MSDRSHTGAASLYDRDFVAWTEHQALAIQEARWSDIDAVNLADEISSLGRQLARELGERIEILLSYLLKWRHLAEYRGRAWKENIERQRETIAELLQANPSLAAVRDDAIARAYEGARRRLRYETYFYETDFPASCPFTVGQVLDESFYPEELDAPATGALPTARKIA